MDELISQVNSFFPHLHVTKEILQNPSREFVLQFYGNFVDNVQELIAYSLGWYQDYLRTDLEPEELIYLKMRLFDGFFNRINSNFLLSDIYDPSPSRTKHFIKLCIYVLNFHEELSTNLEKMNANILEMKENTSKLFNKNDQLRIEINESAMSKSRLLEEIEEDKEQIAKAEAEKEAYLLKRSNLEIQSQQLRKTLEKYKLSVDDHKCEIKKLEEKEKQLLKESISDEEYIQLKESIANLESEKESLTTDDVNMEDLLSHQNRLLGHFENCIKVLPDKFNTELVNKEISMEKKLTDLESEKNNLLCQLASSKTTYVHQKKVFNDSKNAFVQTNLENANIKEQIKEEKDNLEKGLFKKKEELQITLKQCLSENQNYKLHISKLQNDLETLREHFSKEYIKIAKAEKKIVQKFLTN